MDNRRRDLALYRLNQARDSFVGDYVKNIFLCKILTLQIS